MDIVVCGECGGGPSWRRPSLSSSESAVENVSTLWGGWSVVLCLESGLLCTVGS